MTYLRYSRSLEHVTPDEAETFAKIAGAFTKMAEQVAGNEGRRVRPSHAKPTALLDGELEILGDLPPELAQGLAASPGRYPARVRFAQGPGEVLDDRVSTHRGMSVKLSGLEGEHIPEAADLSVQDFVMEGTGRAFINSTASTFLTNLRGGVSNAPSLPEGAKSAVSRAARAAEAGLEAVGLENKTLAFFGHPPTHPLAEPYFSQAPMRWGDHVAKLGFFPTRTTLDTVGETKIDNGDDFNAFRHAMMAYFAGAPAIFELRVQLATDLDTMPIEDASVEWPQDASPYRPVARLTLPAQPAWTAERDAEFEKLSFQPANSLADHRPLGQVMRARLFVYGRIASWRGAGPA